MAMSATTANWHWKSKGVTPWARTWLESELPTVIFTSDDVTIGVSKVNEVDGKNLSACCTFGVHC